MLRRIRMHSAESAHDAYFTATLVPRIWMLSQVRRSRIFQELDVPGIVRAVLAELGLREGEDFELRLNGAYAVSEYTVQYQETDLDFISRLLEHVGIFYFFRQLPDRELLILGDSNAAFDRLADQPFPYAPREAAEGVGGVHRLERELQRRPASVLVRDYNWRTPRVPLYADAAADSTTGVGFQDYYGDHFKTPEEGARIAQVRAQELLATRDLYRGGASILGLSPGHALELVGHHFGEIDQEYVITELRQRVGVDEGDEEAAGLSQSFTAIPFAVAYRPERVTAWPRIEGIMHGFIDGEVPGTAAPIDEHGRYKVLLPFDLAGQPGGRASRWVRMAQASSGPGYGIHFPLHIGVEVAIGHLDGDPDRPIILASPPNAETVTPVRDANATQSKIRTKTGIRITFDDDVA